MRKRNNAMPKLNIQARKNTGEYVSELASKLALQSDGRIGRIAKREAKIKHLAELDTSEARKERRGMNVTWQGKIVPTKVDGFYAGKKGHGKHPLRVKVNGKTRHSLAGVKQIMSPRVSKYNSHY